MSKISRRRILQAGTVAGAALTGLISMPGCAKNKSGPGGVWSDTSSKPKISKSAGEKLGFFMYPIGENTAGRFDSYAPDDFKYQITAKEITG